MKEVCFARVLISKPQPIIESYDCPPLPGQRPRKNCQLEHPSEAFLLVFLLVFFQTQKINHYATKRYKLVRRRPQPPSSEMPSSPQRQLWAFCCVHFVATDRAGCFLSHFQCINQRPQRRGNLPSAGIVEVKAGKRRAPIRQYPL